MSQSNDAVRRFVPGKLTSARLNEVIDNGNETVRRVNKLEAPPDVPRASTPLPCKITDIVSVGKYYADAYLPPYRASEPDPDAIADLAEADFGTRTAQVILWNLAELSGGSALAVDDWVDASVAGLDPSGYPLMKTGGGGGGGSGTRNSLVYITANRTCGGAYKGYIVSDLPSLMESGGFDSSGATFSLDDILASPTDIAAGSTDAEEVTVLNQDEEGQTTHSLTAATQIKHLVLAFDSFNTDDAHDDCRIFIIGDSDSKACA